MAARSRDPVQLPAVGPEDVAAPAAGGSCSGGPSAESRALKPGETGLHRRDLRCPAGTTRARARTSRSASPGVGHVQVGHLPPGVDAGVGAAGADGHGPRGRAGGRWQRAQLALHRAQARLDLPAVEAACPRRPGRCAGARSSAHRPRHAAPAARPGPPGRRSRRPRPATARSGGRGQARRPAGGGGAGSRSAPRRGGPGPPAAAAAPQPGRAPGVSGPRRGAPPGPWRPQLGHGFDPAGLAQHRRRRAQGHRQHQAQVVVRRTAAAQRRQPPAAGRRPDRPGRCCASAPPGRRPRSPGAAAPPRRRPGPARTGGPGAPPRWWSGCAPPAPAAATGHQRAQGQQLPARTPGPGGGQGQP